MNRRVLAALVTLADVHEAKETGVGLDSAYGRGGYVRHQLSDSDYELYESLAIQICAEGKVIQGDPFAEQLLRQARDRTLPDKVEQDK